MSISPFTLAPFTPAVYEKLQKKAVDNLNSASFDLSVSNPTRPDMEELCKNYSLEPQRIVKNRWDLPEKVYEYSNGKFVLTESNNFGIVGLKRISMDLLLEESKNARPFLVSDAGFVGKKCGVVVKKNIKLNYIQFDPLQATSNGSSTLLGFVKAEEATEFKFLTEENKQIKIFNIVEFPGFVDETTMRLEHNTFTFSRLPSMSRDEIFKIMGASPKFSVTANSENNNNNNANSDNNNVVSSIGKSEIPVNTISKQANHASLIFVHCKVEPGSVLQLRGEGCSALSWNEGINLTHVSGNLWALASGLDISTAKAKLVKVMPNNTVVWEKGENRTFTSDAIQACIPQIEGSELPSVGKQEVQKEPLIIKFKAEAQDNGKLMLRGEGGGLTWHKGTPLISLGHDLWACEITSEKASEKIEFKIVKEYLDTKVLWETSANRSFTTGQKPVVLDAVNTKFAP